MQIASIGIDLGKTTFHLVGIGERGQIVMRKKFSRKQLLEHFHRYYASPKRSLNQAWALSGVICGNNSEMA